MEAVAVLTGNLAVDTTLKQLIGSARYAATIRRRGCGDEQTLRAMDRESFGSLQSLLLNWIIRLTPSPSDNEPTMCTDITGYGPGERKGSGATLYSHQEIAMSMQDFGNYLLKDVSVALIERPLDHPSAATLPQQMTRLAEIDNQVSQPV